MSYKLPRTSMYSILSYMILHDLYNTYITTCIEYLNLLQFFGLNIFAALLFISISIFISFPSLHHMQGCMVSATIHYTISKIAPQRVSMSSSDCMKKFLLTRTVDGKV